MDRRMAAGLLFLVCSLAAVAASDPQVGTWKLNVAKSKINPQPKSLIVTIVPYGKDGIKLKTEEINTEGKKRTVEYSAKYDGKEYPRVEAGAGAGGGQTTISLKRIDINRAERSVYSAGKKLRSETWEVSKDGKIRTVTEVGKNSRGETVNTIWVFERQ